MRIDNLLSKQFSSKLATIHEISFSNRQSSPSGLIGDEACAVGGDYGKALGDLRLHSWN